LARPRTFAVFPGNPIQPVVAVLTKSSNSRAEVVCPPIRPSAPIREKRVGGDGGSAQPFGRECFAVTTVSIRAVAETAGAAGPRRTHFQCVRVTWGGAVWKTAYVLPWERVAGAKYAQSHVARNRGRFGARVAGLSRLHEFVRVSTKRLQGWPELWQTA